jgi:hypothetical protein
MIHSLTLTKCLSDKHSVSVNCVLCLRCIYQTQRQCFHLFDLFVSARSFRKSREDRCPGDARMFLWHQSSGAAFPTLGVSIHPLLGNIACRRFVPKCLFVLNILLRVSVLRSTPFCNVAHNDVIITSLIAGSIYLIINYTKFLGSRCLLSLAYNCSFFCDLLKNEKKYD